MVRIYSPQVTKYVKKVVHTEMEKRAIWSHGKVRRRIQTVTMAIPSSKLIANACAMVTNPNSPICNGYILKKIPFALGFILEVYSV